MNITGFWNTWIPVYRRTGYALAAVFVLSVLFFWYYHFQGNATVISWQPVYDQTVFEIPVHSFTSGGFSFTVPAEGYFTYEYSGAGPITLNKIASLIFVAGFSFALIWLITLLTTLEKFWFYVGTALMILVFVSIRFDVLRIYGMSNQMPTIVVCAVFVLSAFYFNSLRPATGFMVRLVTFALLATATALMIAFFSAVEHPFQHLAVTMYTPGLILSVLFIVMIAHEIPASFIYVVSQGASKSLRHFLLITLVYFINLAVTFMHERGMIGWDFFIGAYVLLTLSAVLGLWGFRQREVRYGNIIPFYPFGAYFYLAIGSITFFTAAYMAGNANDAGLQVIRQAVIFTHLGFGIIFITYVISNFILLLAENMNVYKVLYKPNRMPYFTFRFAGLIATLAFVFVSDWRQYVYHGVSGFYNNIADLYVDLGRNTTAEAYYMQAASYGFMNHHANYALAERRRRNADSETALQRYEYANYRRPSEFAYANAGNIYLRQSPFQAIDMYQEGIARLPDAGRLQINLGVAYSKVHALDSALLMFESVSGEHLKGLAGINFMALTAQEGIPIKLDSVYRVLNDNSAGLAANSLAVSMRTQQPVTIGIDPLETTGPLNLHQATLLNNYILVNRYRIDTTFLGRANAIAMDSVNSFYSEALQMAIAMGYYTKNQVNKAFTIMSGLSYLSQSYTGKYSYIMGLWALEQGNPFFAMQCFDIARQYDYKQATLYWLLARAEARQLSSEEAAMYADTEADSVVLKELTAILDMSFEDALRGSDLDKINYVHYHLTLEEEQQFARITEAFVSQDGRATALLEMASRAFAFNDIEKAIRYFNNIDGLNVTNPNLLASIAHFKFRLLASQKQLGAMTELIDAGLTFENGYSLEKQLYDAMIKEAEGDTAAAKMLYERTAASSPYFVEGVIAAARFVQQHSDNMFHAYEILAEAIQTNNANIRLLETYVELAEEVGFDDYANEVRQRIEVLRRGR